MGSLHALCCLLLIATTHAGPAHDSALFSATAKDDPTKIDSALAAGANVNAHSRDMKGHTPLIVAALFGLGKAVPKLLQAGADTSITGDDGFDAMDTAAYYGQWGVVQLLIQHGVELDRVSEQDGFSPIFRACLGKEQHHTDTVNILLRAGVDFEVKRNGKLPVQMAGRKETVDLMRKYRDNRRNTPPPPPTAVGGHATHDPLYDL